MAQAPDSVEIVKGPQVDIHFDGSRCIHSRHCVLTRPDVFVPNAPGEWIHPDRATGPEIIELAHNCPSGAIGYHAHADGLTDEKPPLVNTVRVQENGPLLVEAELHLGDRAIEMRATLCRCGASKNKPFCDSSHHKTGFVATGDIKAQETPKLEKQNSALTITPMKNGPLGVSGPVQIIANDGHKVGQYTKTALCRCGASNNKPFCDGSHVAAGFVAE